MTLPSIFDLCQPRDDVVKGTIADSDYAANLANVLTGRASRDYTDPPTFFTNTYPTEGLKELLVNVCGRLSGRGESVSAVFRLDTSFGGGKTHGLIALVHAATGMKNVSNTSEFLDPALVPKRHVRVAAFDGENADPANGRPMGDGIRAHTPWGEIAYQLAGKVGYEIVRRSDEQRIAPGADTIKELFGADPVLVVLDELGEYLRRVQNMGGRDQLTAFLKALLTAIESTPHAAVVYTLAVRSDGKGIDAFAEENEFLATAMSELESVSGRKATNLNPTRDDETAKVIRRRLFASVDDSRATEVIAAYRALWTNHRDALSEEARRSTTSGEFSQTYPFHPDVLDTLTGKTATLGGFQRVRGMLRILAKTVAAVWANRPADPSSIHLHHIDLGSDVIRREFTTRLQQGAFAPAILNDIAGPLRSLRLPKNWMRSTSRGCCRMAPTLLARFSFTRSPLTTI
jgi:predicted AAA+ superfamily ATPase